MGTYARRIIIVTLKQTTSIRRSQSEALPPIAGTPELRPFLVPSTGAGTDGRLKGFIVAFRLVCVDLPADCEARVRFMGWHFCRAL